jgi:DNA (cytosine-5)-methyltransferase 3A
MIVLSLFDGMSCGQIALNQNGVKVEKYYASEKDKFAIKVTQSNFKDTIQLGDILNWHNWEIDWSEINLILAGSPCQGFSFAGKQLNFNDPRSKLFFVFVDILNHCKKFNPDVKFLLENVNMKKEYQRVINNMLGLFPVRINSNLVSAQNRDRLYWSNIKIKMVGLFNEIHTDIPQPKDRGVLLRDILQDESEVDANYYKGLDNHQQRTGICVDGKAPTQRSSTGRCLDRKHNYQIIEKDKKLRRLTPIECERLQTVPDNFTSSVSDTQRYKMLGNGMTVEKFKHILKYLKS